MNGVCFYSSFYTKASLKYTIDSAANIYNY